MITIYQFNPAFGLIDLSPFVVKLATWCRMAGVEYRFAPGDPRKAPKGKIPYIVGDDGALLGDSSFIIRHLSKKHGDLDAGLSARDRAVGRAVQSMIEEHMYFTTLFLRWQDDRGWTVMGPALTQLLSGPGGVPGFLAGTVSNLVRGRVKKNLQGQGTGRHSVAEVEGLAVELLESLSELVGDGPWLLGDAPRTVDATAWAFLYSLHDAPFDNAVRAKMKSLPNLVAYVERGRARYWSDAAPAASR